MEERNLEEHVRRMSDHELEAARRELATGMALMNPGNGMYAPAQIFLKAVNNELAQRATPEAL
jgi:exonuclease VII small subunit